MTSRDVWTFVTLEISGTDVDPPAVTRGLGVAPTSTSDAAARPLGWGFWTLTTQGHVQGNRLADHLRWLADRLGAPTAALRDLAGAGRARLLAHGAPPTWHLDAEGDEAERVRLGLPLTFVVFVKGDPQVKFVRAELRDPDGEA